MRYARKRAIRVQVLVSRVVKDDVHLVTYAHADRRRRNLWRRQRCPRGRLFKPFVPGHIADDIGLGSVGKLELTIVHIQVEDFLWPLGSISRLCRSTDENKRRDECWE